MKHSPWFFTAFLFTFVISITLAASAHAITLFSDEETLVTGIVTEVARQSFTLESGDARYTVDITDLELADSRTFLEPGLTVAVRGPMSDALFGTPIIEARDMLIVPEEMTELDASRLLLFERRYPSRRYY